MGLRRITLLCLLEKRAIVDSDSEFEEFMKFRKQRRRQEVEDMETETTSAQADRQAEPIDLRPMISRQMSPKREEMDQVMS